MTQESFENVVTRVTTFLRGNVPEMWLRDDESDYSQMLPFLRDDESDYSQMWPFLRYDESDYS